MLPEVLRRIIRKQTRDDRDGPDPTDSPGQDQQLITTREVEFTELLKEHNGRLKQSEIVERTQWAGATVSRTLSEMEERGVIHKISVGRENLVMLVGAEPDWYDPPKENRSAGDDADGGEETILLVEDNAAEARLFREALQEAAIPAEVHVVQDGSDAVQFMRKRGPYKHVPTPSLLLLDLTLRLIDGFDVLRELRMGDSPWPAPVLVLSNSTDEEDIARAYAMGATAYLIKPDDFDERVQLASAIGEFWLHHTVPPAAISEAVTIANQAPDTTVE